MSLGFKFQGAASNDVGTVFIQPAIQRFENLRKRLGRSLESVEVIRPMFDESFCFSLPAREQSEGFVGVFIDSERRLRQPINGFLESPPTVDEITVEFRE